MTEQQHGKMYFGGIPTEPDVKRIMDALGVPEPGLVTHARLEELTGERRTNSRYRTVVNAWRQRLVKEHNIGTAADPGNGIRVLTEPERVEHQARQFRGAARHAVKVQNDTVPIAVEKLDDISRRKYDHLVRATSALATSAVKTNSDLRKALKAPDQLPRLPAASTSAAGT